MILDELLGRTVTLPIARISSAGAHLTLPGDEAAETSATLLLPGIELPQLAGEGDPLSVFVYLDSEDRPIATLRAPRLQLHEVAFLEVTDLTRFGAFVNWGLPKELLVPFAEQTRELSLGDRVAVGLVVDDTDRLAGTMRVRELLETGGDFELDEWVEGEAWRKEPGIGVFVILERRFVGLLPEREPHALQQGQAASFRVAHVFDDGKVELSLRGRVHEELDADADHVLAVLRTPGAQRVLESAAPEQVRALFGLSRKAFKRAVGRLLKRGDVRFDDNGAVVPQRRAQP